MKTSIALIGFMGVGKTAVGKALAVKLDKKFIEMDDLIARKAGKSIPEIFQQDGEITFREFEIGVTREFSGEKNMVIACGGGVVLNKINTDRLSGESVIVYLKATPNVILERVSRGGSNRPLLNVPNRTERIKELLKFRQPYYGGAADITVDTSKLGINAVANKIIVKLSEDEDFNI
jgi:shikimate kinase